MARPRTQGRFDHLVRCAAETFIAARGYHAMQMDDLADKAGVSKGTLYSYFENKAAVFEQALLLADLPSPLPEPENLPVRETEPGASIRYIRERMERNPLPGRLRRIIDRNEPEGGAAKELHSVVTLLFESLWDHRVGIKLIDVCAKDHPEIASAWFSPGRDSLVAMLEELMVKRARSGHYLSPPSTHLAARYLLETCVFWAIHIHWDPHPERMDRAETLDSICVLISRGFLPGST